MTRPQSVVGRETLHRIIAAAGEFTGAVERNLCFRGLHSTRLQEGIAIGGLQLQSLATRSRRSRAVRRPIAGRQPVRHLDGLAEVRDRLLECRAAQRLVAGLAPPFDGGVDEAPPA